ncbi:PQQ-binding-like beta-propeller repeat protein [candidate division KSB1 bacterium]|nr:PQQ-binding-like beta-propeller repeat protein [candidate division KSB1 bacterium]
MTRKYLTYLKMLLFFFCAFSLLLIQNCSRQSESDWTTFRHDNQHSGISQATIQPPLSLCWIHQPIHSPQPAWMEPAEELPRMHYDNAHHATVAAGLVYFASTVDNKIYALDLASGEVNWQFFTEGPVRYAPTIDENRLYAGSDDGYVYCLSADRGELVWKYRPGPGDDKILGNGRMISRWPIRTSVIAEDGIVYFGAGVFPYEGLYICALDAKTGNIIWKNDTVGDYTHEHRFGGITPQGYLMLSENILYVPSGRDMPAAFDKNTGELLFTLDPGSKVGGIWGLLVEGELITGIERSGTPAKVAYDSRTGKRIGDAFATYDGIDLAMTGTMAYVLTRDGVYSIDRQRSESSKQRIEKMLAGLKSSEQQLRVLRIKIPSAEDSLQQELNAQIDSLVQHIAVLHAEKDSLNDASLNWQYSWKHLHTLAVTKTIVFAAGVNTVIALDRRTGKLVWQENIEGIARGLTPCKGHLLVSNDLGEIYCFSQQRTPDAQIVSPTLNNSPYESAAEDDYERIADSIISMSDIHKGYCLILGCSDGQLAFELAKRTQLKIIGIDTDAEKLTLAKQRLDAAGTYGARIVTEHWSLASLPDYFADLIISDEMIRTGKLSDSPDDIFRVLKPTGGVLLLGQPSIASGLKPDIDSLLSRIKRIGTAPPETLRRNGEWVKFVRGELPGAGSWLSQYANPQNTACSDDKLIKGPLGVLWYGEPGPNRMVERHAKAASPVSAEGRLFVQGENVIMAYNAYNGTLLWEREIDGAVRARADADGGNLAIAKDGLFVAAKDKCYQLDPATGDALKIYTIPSMGKDTNRRWGAIACDQNVLFGSAAFPLKNEYNIAWQEMVNDDGTWKQRDELPPDYWVAYDRYVESDYPLPDENAVFAFQRDGTKWRFIADFPYWDGGNHGMKPTDESLMGGDGVFAIDIQTGATKWIHRGKRISNISICMDDGAVYFVDDKATQSQRRTALQERQDLFRQGIWEAPAEEIKPENIDIRVVVALNANTGKTLWEKPMDLTGCGGNALATAIQDDILLFFGSYGLHDKWRFPEGQLTWHRVTALSTKIQKTLWSRPLNYMTRPLIVGEEVIIEPRACDLKTGKIKTRRHPVTGREVPWEFYRPGHTCAGTSATEDGLFYRSYCTAFYDLEKDAGLTYFGAIRPGCWINLIPANGVLLFPEASSGCTCSFPLRSTVVLKTRKREAAGEWNVYISSGPMTPVKRLAINLGAPGDRIDADGALWLGYPRPDVWYGVKLDLHEKTLPGMGYFSSDVRYAAFETPENPWLFSSGCTGLTGCQIPLIDDFWGEKPGVYTVKLGFAAPAGDRAGQRIFDMKLQDETVMQAFDIIAAAGKPHSPVIKEFKGIPVNNDLRLAFVPAGSIPDISSAPIVNFIEITREDDAESAIKSGTAVPVNLKRATSLLKSAEAAMKRNQRDLALELYQGAFYVAPDVAPKVAALKGLTRIASLKSLPLLEPYCRNVSPILHNYQSPPEALKNAAINLFITIARQAAHSDRSQAAKMLRHAFTLVDNLKLRLAITKSLDSLNVKIDAGAAKKGYVTRWHICGLFPWDQEKYPLAKQFIGEPAVDLSVSYLFEQKAIIWQPVVSQTEIVNLIDIFGRNRLFAIYALTEIEMTDDCEATLRIGSDDGFKCWLNGEVVGMFDDGRGYTQDEDVLKVNMKKGVNQLLLKIFNWNGNSSFSLKVADADGQPLPFYIKF